MSKRSSNGLGTGPSARVGASRGPSGTPLVRVERRTEPASRIVVVPSKQSSTLLGDSAQIGAPPAQGK